jgi:hypothetical protein
MKDMMAAYRSQISGVVVTTVVETFNQMLRQRVTAIASKHPPTPGPDAAVYACVRLDQKNTSADFFFSFDRALLLMTAEAFYPKDLSSQNAVQEDIACAVANIVGGRVKTFLIRQGYEFEMGIPFVVQKGKGGGSDDIIHVHFSYNQTGDNGLVVNYMVSEKKAALS